MFRDRLLAAVRVAYYIILYNNNTLILYNNTDACVGAKIVPISLLGSSFT